MSFSVERDENASVVAVEGALVANNRLEFKRLVLDEVAQGGRHFRVDFRDASYVDSSGLGALVSVARTIRDRGGEIRIVNLNADLRELFELTKLDTLFGLEGDGGAELDGQPARLKPSPNPPLRQGGALSSRHRRLSKLRG